MTASETVAGRVDFHSTSATLPPTISSCVDPLKQALRQITQFILSGSQGPIIKVSYNDRVRKGLKADFFYRIRPSDYCQVVCRVEKWYRLRVKGVF